VGFRSRSLRIACPRVLRRQSREIFTVPPAILTLIGLLLAWVVTLPMAGLLAAEIARALWN